MGKRREPRKASLEVNTLSGDTDSKGEQMHRVMKLERPLWKAAYFSQSYLVFHFLSAYVGI